MSAVNSIDENTLIPYLQSQVEGFKGPLVISKFDGGQSNPTFKLEAASGSYVLRRQPPGKLLKSAHAVDREYRVLEALRDTDVPVAKVYHLCQDTDIIGSMFYIMEFCEGNIYWASSLKDINSNTLRGQMYDEMNRVLAAIHSVNLQQVGLADYGRPGNYFERQFERWSKQYKASEIEPIPQMDQLIKWLSQNIPDDDGKVSLVHGDYRLDNLMFSPDNSRVIAVLDWELSTLGHPYADLAYQCMGFRLPSNGLAGASSGLGGIDAGALGIPSEDDYVDQYCQRIGINTIDNWPFYIAFSFFRLAAICQGVAKRGLDGNASSSRAISYQQMVGPLAQSGLDATS